jgi:hypothetical protein
MSILKRPGWNNYEIIEEGRLHNDKLKEKIGKIFDRLSLGYSPNHVVDKISSIIRHEKGDKMDISKVSDEYIISVASSDAVTRGKFTPTLKSSYASTYQNTNAVDPSYSQPEETEPVSLNFTATSTPASVPQASIPSVSFQEDSEDDEEDDEYNNEDAEEVKTCGCEKKQMVFNPEIAKKNLNRVSSPDKGPIKKESVKLSPTAINKLLKENFIKNKQHKFKMEERYRVY